MCIALVGLDFQAYLYITQTNFNLRKKNAKPANHQELVIWIFLYPIFQTLYINFVNKLERDAIAIQRKNGSKYGRKYKRKYGRKYRRK